MSRRGAVAWAEWGAIILIVIGAAVLAIQLNSYSNFRERYPTNMLIAGVDVGGLTRDEAAQQITAVYNSEIDLYYQGERIPLDPADVEFSLDMEPMLQAASEQQDAQSFWSGFWDFLWNRQVEIEPVDLQASFTPRRLQAILANIAATRDAPPQPPVPVPATLDFQPGEPGYQMNLEASQPLIEAALLSSSSRQSTLVVDQLSSPDPDLEILGRLIENRMSDFGGIYSISVIDLQSGQILGIDPGIAYSGMSILKIPIMVVGIPHAGPPPQHRRDQIADRDHGRKRQLYRQSGARSDRRGGQWDAGCGEGHPVYVEPGPDQHLYRCAL